MKLGFSMEIKQTHKLHLTRELIQAIELLQLSSQEVESLIEEELNENPVLESIAKPEIDWAKYANNIKKIGSSWREEQDFQDNDNNTDNLFYDSVNLFDHLEKEILGIQLSDKEKVVAYYIIERVNESGYYAMSTIESAQENNISEKEFIKILKKLQHVEPTGLLARDLKECLSLQIEKSDPKNRVVMRIIQQDLENIAAKKYGVVQKKHHLTDEELREAIGKIKSLDPRPGKKFSNFAPSFILPDVIVEKTGDWFEVIDNATLPNLYISDFYQRVLNETEDEEAKEYIKDKLNRGMTLIRKIEQRRNTIIKVAEEIVKKQKQFFVEGRESIVPMKLKDIAEATGFHESTISRTVNGKYMMTPLGIFEFKYFFTTGLATNEGSDISSKNIKEHLQTLIKSEDKTKPMSDQKLCESLRSKGIQISRRTVAKYREEMNIAGSHLRKEI